MVYFFLLMPHDSASMLDLTTTERSVAIVTVVQQPGIVTGHFRKGFLE